MCQSFTSLPSVAYLATGCMVVLLASAIFAYFAFRRSEQNRRVFLLPLLSLVPTLLITLQDWHGVASLNEENIAAGGEALQFPPPWIVSGYSTTNTPVPLLLGTLAIVALILLMAWVQRFADR